MSNKQRTTVTPKHGAASKSTKAQIQAASDARGRRRRRAAVIAMVVIGVVVAAVAATVGLGTDDPARETLKPTADEARYMGRLLPASYQAPFVGTPGESASAIEMTELTAGLAEDRITLPVADVTDARIALFTYARADGSTLPLIAYVKPSGELFVGVSFCPPCEGEWQTIQPDGTLTCNACGTKRDLETGIGISGSCRQYPLDELPATLSDGTLSIDRAALDSWTPQPLDRQVG